MAPISVICFRPCFSMISSAELPSRFQRASKTFFAMLFEIVLSAMRAIRPASCAGSSGALAISSS
jgi:hypothetical protein